MAVFRLVADVEDRGAEAWAEVAEGCRRGLKMLYADDEDYPLLMRCLRGACEAAGQAPPQPEAVV